jgi:phosphatidylserine decarboxylase
MGNPRFEYLNERRSILLKADDGFTVAVVQIASFLARTIKNKIGKHDSIRQGEVYGMIRFGSQVDLVIDSADVQILVKKNDRVYAGITRVAERIMS